MRMKLAGWVLGLMVCCVAAPAFEAIAWAQEATDPDAPPPPPKPEEKPSAITKIASYGLSIAGTFVVAALVVYTLSRTLKYEQARNAIIHLLRTAPNQAEMQCKTLPYSFAEPIGAALKTGAMVGTDLALIQQTTAPTYDAMCQTVVQHWKGLLGKAKLATMAVLAAIIVRPGPVPIVLGVLAVGGLAWMWFYKAEVDRSIFRAKVEILPDVDRALAEGRYYVPPKQ